jgi:enoyl-CoA hydratase/carnithine racemase
MNADKPTTQEVYVGDYFRRRCERGCAVLELVSADHTNKLGIAAVMEILEYVRKLQDEAECGRLKALIITGNDKFFSAGADLKEIARVSGPEAFEFSRTGQRLMNSIDNFPVPVIAAIRGYCMGGGMDLALACDYRIAAPHAVFGHRGASLGVITGWGGTQRLPRLIGKPRALQMFLLAEMVGAEEALRIGLVDQIVANPVAEVLLRYGDSDGRRESAKRR